MVLADEERIGILERVAAELKVASYAAYKQAGGLYPWDFRAECQILPETGEIVTRMWGGPPGAGSQTLQFAVFP